jgi:hypothetical protein
MVRFSIFTVAAGLAASGVVLAALENHQARTPVLLELFTSEGCSSCPPADRLLQELDGKQPVEGADLIVLSEHVDYWNRLGWTDPYSSAQFSARQQDYSDKYHFDGVYTPQLAVDGRFGLVGSDARAAEAAIRKAMREPKIDLRIVQAARKGNQVTATVELPAAAGQAGVLYVALADDRAESHVSRGENAGRALSHVAVARSFQQLGRVDLAQRSAKAVSLAVPQNAGASGLRVIAFVQDAKTGHVIGVTRQEL